jgi:hypothetical protein
MGAWVGVGGWGWGGRGGVVRGAGKGLAQLPVSAKWQTVQKATATGPRLPAQDQKAFSCKHQCGLMLAHSYKPPMGHHCLRLHSSVHLRHTHTPLIHAPQQAGSAAEAAPLLGAAYNCLSQIDLDGGGGGSGGEAGQLAAEVQAIGAQVGLSPLMQCNCLQDACLIPDGLASPASPSTANCSLAAHTPPLLTVLLSVLPSLFCRY